MNGERKLKTQILPVPTTSSAKTANIRYSVELTIKLY
jgi:hypothetical protein